MAERDGNRVIFKSATEHYLKERDITPNTVRAVNGAELSLLGNFEDLAIITIQEVDEAGRLTGQEFTRELLDVTEAPYTLFFTGGTIKARLFKFTWVQGTAAKEASA